MEIKNNLNPLDPYAQTRLTNAAQTNQAANRAADSASAPARDGGDRVSLSPEARLRTEAFSTAMNAPDVRAEKVAELKARVESGEYQVDAASVAAKLLREEPGLFRP